jgi:hypothetical protein
MSAKPENAFIDSVHRHMPKLEVDGPSRPYREKMFNPLRGGTWDVYYSGKKDDAWIEYKFLIIPKRGTTLVTPTLSDLQKLWGANRAAEGRTTRVIVGCALGGVVYESRTDWEGSMTVDQFRAKLLDRKAVAEYIIALVEGA